MFDAPIGTWKKTGSSTPYKLATLTASGTGGWSLAGTDVAGGCSLAFAFPFVVTCSSRLLSAVSALERFEWTRGLNLQGGIFYFSPGGPTLVGRARGIRASLIKSMKRVDNG